MVKKSKRVTLQYITFLFYFMWIVVFLKMKLRYNAWVIIIFSN